MSAAVGKNGSPAPKFSQEVGGVGPDGNLYPLSVDNAGVLNVNAVIGPPVGGATSANQVLEIAQLTAINSNTTGSATAAKQDTGNASLASIDSKLTAPLSVTGPLTDTQLRASAVPVSAASLPLPAGASTSALQSAGNASLASIDTKLTNPLPVSGTVSVSNFPATQPVSGTVAATQSGTWNVGLNAGVNNIGSITDITGTISLPTGASTSALQSAGNASLSSIDTKLTSPLAVTGPLTDTQLRASAVPVSLASSPLPTGAATSANQATEIASLASIDSKLTSPLSVVSGALVTGTYAEITNLTTTAQTFTAPASAVGFNLEALSDNTNNLRWKVGATASTTSGMRLEPGRDTGYLPFGASVSVCAEAGTNQVVTINWISP